MLSSHIICVMRAELLSKIDAPNPDAKCHARTSCRCYDLWTKRRSRTTVLPMLDLFNLDEQRHNESYVSTIC